MPPGGGVPPTEFLSGVTLARCLDGEGVALSMGDGDEVSGVFVFCHVTEDGWVCFDLREVVGDALIFRSFLGNVRKVTVL